MNDEIRDELYNEMIQNNNELSHDEIINTLDILFYKLDLTKEQSKDKDYLRDQIDNIIDY
tara:strand:+ start:141 stop:320 length:180 start_codon:yes stop_codon:yes gene_type:complete